MPEVRRMRCPSKRHPQTFELPPDSVTDSDARVVLRTGKVIGGWWVNDPVLCEAPTPCYEDHPVYGPRARATMRLWLIRGRRSSQACGPRCMGATGPDCECECAGANHGRGGVA